MQSNPLLSDLEISLGRRPYFCVLPLYGNVKILPLSHGGHHPPSSLVDSIYMGAAKESAFRATASNELKPQYRTVPDDENDLTPIQWIPLKYKDSYNNSARRSTIKKNSKMVLTLDSFTTDSFLGRGYKHRNVFKSIIRKMYGCVQTRRKKYLGLVSKGFTRASIEGAFTRVATLKNAERKNGKKRTGMDLIKQAAQEHSVYTYILRDALDSMLKSWKADQLGRLTERNLETYRRVCNAYYKLVERLLENEK